MLMDVWVLQGDMVQQVDREMPGARMTMLIQSEKPKFMVSAKTGLSTWVRIKN